MRALRFCATVAAGLALTGCIYTAIDEHADGSRSARTWRWPGIGNISSEAVRGETDYITFGQDKAGAYALGGRGVDALAGTLAIAIPLAAQLANQQAALEAARPAPAPTPSPAPIVNPEPRAPAPLPAVTPAPGPVVAPLAGDNVFNPANP